MGPDGATAAGEDAGARGVGGGREAAGDFVKELVGEAADAVHAELVGEAADAVHATAAAAGARAGTRTAGAHDAALWVRLGDLQPGMRPCAGRRAL